MFKYLCGTFNRLILYQIIFVFAYFRFQNFQKSTYEFKDKVYELNNSLSFTHPLLDEAFKNPVLVFQAFVGIQVFCAFLAILGSRFFGFLAALCLIVDTVIYNNPLIPAAQTQQHGYALTVGKFDLNINMEFILSITLVLAMLAHSFKSGSGSCCPSTHHATPGEKVTVESEKARTNKPTSGKKKHI